MEFNRVPRGHSHTIVNKSMILIDGEVTINGRTSGVGCYQLYSDKGVVKGPAKYYVGETPFELSRRSEMRMSEAIRRGVRPDGPSLYDKALRD